MNIITKLFAELKARKVATPEEVEEAMDNAIMALGCAVLFVGVLVAMV